MNRRRFLGLTLALGAIAGTRVPEQASAEPAAPTWQDGHAAGFQDGYAAAENALIAQRAVWDFDDLMAAQAASRTGVLYERFTQDNEIAAMARRDRERGA